MRKNILSYLEDTAERLPDKLAFSTGKEGMTFGELLSASQSIGSALVDDGAYGEPVVIFMDKHPRALASFFGAIYAGCFYVCIDEKMPEARMRAILDNLSPRFLILWQADRLSVRYSSYLYFSQLSHHQFHSPKQLYHLLWISSM